MDITDFDSVMRTVAFHDPDLIVNLAAQKLAVVGELDSWRTVNTNINGVKNLLDVGRPILHVSSCKAGTRMCTYGYTKMIGERLTMNWGSSVVRLYNVPFATPSVVSI